MKVKESSSKILVYLQDRNIVAQYKKAKAYIQEGKFQIVKFKKRQPLSSNIYQFRITDKYRAFAELVNNELIVFSISDHQ